MLIFRILVTTEFTTDRRHDLPSGHTKLLHFRLYISELPQIDLDLFVWLLGWGAWDSTLVPLVRWHMCYHCTILTVTSIEFWTQLFFTIILLDQESMCRQTVGVSSNPLPTYSYAHLWPGGLGVTTTPLSDIDIPLHSIHLSILSDFI